MPAEPDDPDSEDAETEDAFPSLSGGSTDSAAVEARYDDWAKSYDHDLEMWNYQAPEEAAAALVPYLRKDESVLDLGCGTGMFGRALANRLKCRIEGIDISAKSLAVAGKRDLYAMLYRHDLQKLPLPLGANGFDAAVSVGVLTYMSDPEALLKEMCRVVRAGGHLLFTQRDDRWQELEFDRIMVEFDKNGLWTALGMSEPRPYLPRHQEFAEEIQVIHVLCEVK
jgi:predicted TPR repeat methyltransferase